jgi:hypothetical protein
MRFKRLLDSDMTMSLTEILKEFDFDGQASAETIKDAEDHFGIQLPADYKSFMINRGGGEGFVGDAHYLVLWQVSKLIEHNRDLEVEKYAPGLLLFGSTGSGEGFAFDARPGENMIIRVVPFIGMDLEDAKPIADTFEKFLFRQADPNAALF